MLKLRQNLVDAEEQLIDLKRKFAEVDAELSVTKKELTIAKSDCLYSLIPHISYSSRHSVVSSTLYQSLPFHCRFCPYSRYRNDGSRANSE